MTFINYASRGSIAKLFITAPAFRKGPPLQYIRFHGPAAKGKLISWQTEPTYLFSILCRSNWATFAAQTRFEYTVPARFITTFAQSHP